MPSAGSATASSALPSVHLYHDSLLILYFVYTEKAACGNEGDHGVDHTSRSERRCAGIVPSSKLGMLPMIWRTGTSNEHAWSLSHLCYLSQQYRGYFYAACFLRWSRVAGRCLLGDSCTRQ